MLTNVECAALENGSRRPVGPKFLPFPVALVITIRTLSPFAASAFDIKFESLSIQEHKSIFQPRIL